MARKLAIFSLLFMAAAAFGYPTHRYDATPVAKDNTARVLSRVARQHSMMMPTDANMVPAVGQLGHITGTKCPVCGTANNATTKGVFVNVKNGTQKIFACSQEHGELVFKNPLTYLNASAIPTPIGSNVTNTNFTYVVPNTGSKTIECPFCKMDSVKEHAIHFNHGQALYACVMPPHNGLLQNETALTAKFSGIVPVSAIKCPVCAFPVDTNNSYYVSVKNGTQKIHVCSEEHGKLVMAAPISKHLMSAVTPVKANGTMPAMTGGHGNMSMSGNFTPAVPRVECPFCKMDGVTQHSIKLKHGQPLYACMMPGHNAMLQNETALMGKMDALMKSDGGKAPDTQAETGTKTSSGVRAGPGMWVVGVVAALGLVLM